MEEMDVLGYLKSRQNELERVKHPFANRSLAFRYLYSYGVGVLALGSMKSMTELTDKYEFFLGCIALPREQRERIITDINNYFELRLTDCVRMIRTKEVQYCFMADLFKLYNITVWAKEYCEKIIENFIQSFHMSEPEIAFLKSFNDATVKQDVDRARRCYDDFRSQGFDISYKILKYFFPEFHDMDVYQDIVIHAGKTLRLDKVTKISGNILVERGGSLLFDGADVTIDGAIEVCGGRFQLLDTKLLVHSCSRDFFLSIQDAAVVRIENSTIDCNGECGFLSQNSGRLLVEESEFNRSRRKRMIEFSGRYARILRSSFADAEAGFFLASGFSQIVIEKCEFIQAYAEYGGAIFSDSVDNVIVRDSAFHSCNAKYLGSAIYFKYQKLGQVVRDCVFGKCEPAESMMFNVYEDDFELKIR